MLGNFLLGMLSSGLYFSSWGAHISYWEVSLREAVTSVCQADLDIEARWLLASVGMVESLIPRGGLQLGMIGNDKATVVMTRSLQVTL